MYFWKQLGEYMENMKDIKYIKHIKYINDKKIHGKR